MSLRVNNNIAAMNSYRNLTATESQMSKSLEKLSSGFRINRAADDAAGLAISEQLRSQVNGLKVAQRNAQDGISVIQTAEGALTEVHSLLQRVRDLAVQAANTGANDTASREQAAKEVTSALTEIDRIASATKFGGKALLAGDLTDPTKAAKFTFQVGSEAGDVNKIDVDIKAMNVTGLSLNGSNVDVSTDGIAVASLFNPDFTENIDITIANAAQGTELSKTVDFNLSSLTSAEQGALTAGVSDTGYAAAKAKGEALLQKSLDDAFGQGALKGELVDDGLGNFSIKVTTLGAGIGSKLSMSTEDANTLTGLPTASGGARESLAAVTDLTGGLRDLIAQGKTDAISKIDEAIKNVSAQRGDLGAYQNRLEHTIANLAVTTENLTASESRIRDTDMAQEMTNYTKNQILVQAGTAMLAQANSSSQGVLSLLRG